MPDDNAARNSAANARVTQAVLKQVVENNTIVIKRSIEVMDDHEERIRNNEIEQARQDERIDNLNTKVKIDIAGTAIGGAILALAAALGIKQ
jgi:hypothetical protein